MTGPGQNMAAKFGPGGPDVAAIFDPRMEFCCQTWSPCTLQNVLLLVGPNMVAIIHPVLGPNLAAIWS